MSKVGGAGQAPAPPITTESTPSSTETKETKSRAESSSSQTQESTRSSEQHAKTKMEESKLGGQLLQSQLHESIPKSAGAGQYQDLSGQGRFTPGPVKPGTIDVTKEPAFQALPEATQKKLLKEIKDPDAAGKLQQVMNHKVYQGMTPDQKTKALNVFSNLGPKGQTSLTHLMNREVVIGSGDPPPKMPAILSGDNTKAQTTLLDHLNKMTDQPLHPSLANRRKELLADVIQQTG